MSIGTGIAFVGVALGAGLASFSGEPGLSVPISIFGFFAIFLASCK